MKELFRSQKQLTEDDYKTLWQKAIFILDTNILLDVYRLPESAKEDLLNILADANINNRLWLPFQAALEYTHNKIDAISDQKNKFQTVRSIVNDSISELDVSYDSLIKKLDDLQLKKRHSVIDPDKFIDENLFKDAKEILNNFLEELNNLDEKQPDVNNPDILQERIFKILEGKVGESFNKQELEEIFKEGDLRYKDSIPPGYKDRDKPDFYLFEDKKYIRKYGDLVLWKEIIRKTKDENLEYVILITADSKEDWWQKKRGRKLGPRYELLNEIYFNATSLKIFHMYDTAGLMQYSKQYLGIDIKEQSIKETKDLIEFNKTTDQITTTDLGVIAIRDIFQRVSSHIPIKLRLPGGYGDEPFIFMPEQLLHLVIMEIFSNVYNHSTDKVAIVRFSQKELYFVITFRNSVLEGNHHTEFRGMGIKNINAMMSGYGYVETELRDNYFQTKLNIDKKFVSKHLMAESE